MGNSTDDKAPSTSVVEAEKETVTNKKKAQFNNIDDRVPKKPSKFLVVFL